MVIAFNARSVGHGIVSGYRVTDWKDNEHADD